MHIADAHRTPTGIFAYTLHPTRVSMLTDGPTADERALAGAHWAYSQKLLVDGVVVFAGRTLVPTADGFAIVVVRAPSLDAARAIADADPAVRGGLFHAAVYPYQPMLMGAWPPEAATVTTPAPPPPAG